METMKKNRSPNRLAPYHKVLKLDTKRKREAYSEVGR